MSDTQAATEPDHLRLKWGTLKDWSGVKSDAGQDAIERYFNHPSALGAMQQQDTAEQKAAICDLIDAVAATGGTIQNDWSGDIMQPDEAKAYVMGYRS